MMDRTTRFARDVLDRNEAILFAALDGLTSAQLHEQPGPDSNPIGWLMWHLSRVQDNHVSAMEGSEHVWVAQLWYEQFGRDDDPGDRGRGHSSEQVAEFRSPDVETLLAYYQAVRSRTDAFLDGLGEADLDRAVPNLAGDGTVPMHVRLEMTLVDNIQHSGQIAYLRGLLKGKGWLAA